MAHHLCDVRFVLDQIYSQRDQHVLVSILKMDQIYSQRDQQLCPQHWLEMRNGSVFDTIFFDTMFSHPWDKPKEIFG